MEKSIQEKYIDALETIIQLKAHIDMLNMRVLSFMTEHESVPKETKANLQVLQFPEESKTE